MATQDLSRQQTRTRLALMNAAIQLISEVGFENIRVKSITDRADYGSRVFYLHFKDKEDILYHIITHWVTQTTNNIFSKVQNYPSPEREYRALQMIVESWIKQVDFLRQAVTSTSGIFHDRILNFAVQDIKKHIEMDNIALHPDMSPEIVSEFHAGMMIQAFRKVTKTGNIHNSKEIVDDLFRFTFRQEPPDLDS